MADQQHIRGCGPRFLTVTHITPRGAGFPQQPHPRQTFPRTFLFRISVRIEDAHQQSNDAEMKDKRWRSLDALAHTPRRSSTTHATYACSSNRSLSPSLVVKNHHVTAPTAPSVAGNSLTIVDTSVRRLIAVQLCCNRASSRISSPFATSGERGPSRTPGSPNARSLERGSGLIVPLSSS